jgi:hypothetical protein
MAILEDVIANIRAGRRNIKLRGESDPQAALAELQAILIEAIHVQNSGSKGMQKRALEELKQIRRDMVAGHISAGSKTNQAVGTYTHVIDQVESMLDQTRQNNQVYEGAIDSIKNSIPSADSLVAALMTANPLVGYGVKIFRDMSKSRQEARQKARQIESERLKVLSEQENVAREQLSWTEEQRQEAEKEKGPMGEKQRAKPYSKMTQVLYEIKDILLERVGTNQSPEDESKIVKVDSDNDEVENKLQRVEEQLENVNNSIIETASEQIAHEERMEKRRERNSRLTRMKEPTGGLPTGPTPVEPKGVTQGKKGGFLGALLRGLGLLSLKGTGLLSIFKPLTMIIGFIKGFGAMALKIGSKVLLPLAVLKGIYDFFDGFFSAADWLGRADSELSILDRIKMGVMSAISGFISLFTGAFSWITGITTPSKEEMAVAMFKFVEDIQTAVVDWVSNAYDKIVNFFSSIPETVMNLLDGMGNAIVAGYDIAINKVTEVFNKITDTFKSIYQAIEDKLSSWRQSLSEIPGIGRLFKTDEEEAAEAQKMREANASGAAVLAQGRRLEMTTGIPVTSGALANIERVSNQMDSERRAKELSSVNNIVAPNTTNVNSNQTIFENRTSNNPNTRLYNKAMQNRYAY